MHTLPNTDFPVALLVQQCAGAQEVKAHPAWLCPASRVTRGGWGLLQSWGRRAHAHPSAHSGLCWSPGEGWFCYLAWFVFAKILSYWTDLTTFCCIYYRSVILPSLVSAPACVMVSDWTSGKQQIDACIKHMRKNKTETPKQNKKDSEKGRFKRAFRIVKHRHMWKSAYFFFQTK